MLRNRIIHLLLFTLFLLSSNLSNCQNSSFKHYNVNDGLPSSETYHVYQDSKGYIWIATDLGVSRFDGYNFENFDIKDGLTDDTVFEIFEDSKGRIWFIPFSCKLCYFKNDSIYQYKYNSVITNNFKTGILAKKRSFYVDKKDNVFLSIDRRGLLRIDSKGNLQVLGRKNHYQFDKYDNKILASNIATPYSKILLNIDSPGVIETNDQMVNCKIFAELIDSEKIILNTKNKIFKIINNQIQKEEIINKSIIWLSKDNVNNIWIGTRDGVYKYDSNLDKKNLYLKDKSITSVFQDNEGSYWFSTLEDGIYYMPSDKIFVLNKEDGLIDNKVLKLEKGKNSEIWLGYSTPYISNIKGNNITNYKASELKKSNITSFLYDNENDKLWFSTDESLFSLKNNKKEIYYDKTSKTKYIYPNDIAKINNRFWIATSRGILKFINNALVYNSSINSEFAYRTHSLFIDKDSSLLIGGLNGLWKYDNKKFINLGIKNPILSTRITKIKRINSNTIGLGTKGAGLLLYAKDTIIPITRNDGLLSNSINSIFAEDSTIWLATSNGLSKINFADKKNFSIENYSNYNGFSAKEVNDVCVVNNTVYAASNNGLIYFDKTRITQNNCPPPILIKNIRIQNQTKNLKKQYKLSYKENFFNIDYIGLSYRKAGNLQYKYRMIGIDTNWIYTTKTTVQYTTLPYGHYTFEVSAMNEDNIWSTEPAIINFNISPPVYKRWWFIILTIILVTGILYFVYSTRITEIKNKNQLKNNINEYKQQILRQQMNPHFIFNTLNSIQYFLLEKDTDSSLDYLSKFAKLMRMILENTQHTVIAIDDEINALELYLELESLRFEDNFSFNINIDDRINTLDWKMPALLLQPYVENSIKHGFTKILDNKKGQISIDMTLVNNHILCSVEDNGIGREKANIINLEKSNTHKSLGSKITADRVYLLNSLYGENINVKYIDKKDDNNQSQGTRVEIIIPVII